MNATTAELFSQFQSILISVHHSNHSKHRPQVITWTPSTKLSSMFPLLSARWTGWQNTPHHTAVIEIVATRVFAKVHFQKLLENILPKVGFAMIFSKKGKMHFIEGRIWWKVAVILSLYFIGLQTHRTFVRGRTPLQGPIALQTGQTLFAVGTNSTSCVCTEDWEGTLSMTRRRNIKDVQVNRRYGALCVRDQCLLQVVMNFALLVESDARRE